MFIQGFRFSSWLNRGINLSLHILVSYLFYQQAISRVDSRPKLERYLKRFCRRLICCEFFLSLKPVPTPCPDRCQADGGKELLVLDVVKKNTHMWWPKKSGDFQRRFYCRLCCGTGWMRKSVIWTLKKLDIWFLFHRCRVLVLKFALDYVC